MHMAKSVPSVQLYSIRRSSPLSHVLNLCLNGMMFLLLDLPPLDDAVLLGLMTCTFPGQPLRTLLSFVQLSATESTDETTAYFILLPFTVTWFRLLSFTFFQRAPPPPIYSLPPPSRPVVRLFLTIVFLECTIVHPVIPIYCNLKSYERMNK